MSSTVVHAVQHEVEREMAGRTKTSSMPSTRSMTRTNDNKKIALLISVLALFLAFSETLGKSAQTAALNYQIEASNLWNFFQAKNIRRTADHRRDRAAPRSIWRGATDPAQKAALTKQIDDWNKTAARYRSEPEAGGGKGEGTVELVAPRHRRAARSRPSADQVPPLRVRLGGVPDRHRAGLGGGHHQHDGAGLCGDRRRAWSASRSSAQGCSCPNCCTTSCIGCSICSPEAAPRTIRV